MQLSRCGMVISVLTFAVHGSRMASKLVIKLRAFDSHALKCAALAAAMKEEIILDKVPLATALKGVPLLTTDAVLECMENLREFPWLLQF